jgi:glycosyltransferase involved in cell wall biosynthesis
MTTTSPIDISTVICTTGSRSFHVKTVDSLLKQSLDSRRYEILVVLNHPDASRLVSFKRELFMAVGPHEQLRIVQETLPGLSFARNKGTEEARGRYVAYIDDDACASLQWLEFIVEAFERDANIGAVGGDIDPLWEKEKPDWITLPMYTYFSCKQFASEAKYMPEGSYFFGANMAFTRELLQACGGFPTNLGRVRGNLLSNEEWPVFEYVDTHGFKKWYSPVIKVDHLVTAERMTIRFFIRRLWWQGISNTVHSLECKGKSRMEVARQGGRTFIDFYRNVPEHLRHGHTSVPLVFFNLFRWAGIFTHLGKSWISERLFSK